MVEGAGHAALAKPNTLGTSSAHKVVCQTPGAVAPGATAARGSGAWGDCGTRRKRRPHT